MARESALAPATAPASALRALTPTNMPASGAGLRLSGCDVVPVIHPDVRGQPALRLVLAEIERAGGELRGLDYRQDARGRSVRLHVTEISDGWSPASTPCRAFRA